MRNIKDLIGKFSKYKNFVVHHQYKSKKNTVAYVTINGKPRVIKWFVPGFKLQMQKESNILKKGSSKLNIPYLYEIDNENNILILSYIIGENLCDIINNEDVTFEEKERLMVLLADWYVKFHNYFKTEDNFFIRGDSNLRNFIFSDKIWGLDFEESRIGNPIKDIGDICSSILCTDPMFTNEKFHFCDILIQSYKDSIRYILGSYIDEISYSLLERIQWRPNDEKIIRKYSKKIKERGLT
jgi:tRNA A-37 threonylcarbamoyl transferase component Bud32